MSVINLQKTYAIELGKSNGICEIKHACDIKTGQPQAEEQHVRQSIKLSRKKTSAVEELEVNEESIKIFLRQLK